MPLDLKTIMRLICPAFYPERSSKKKVIFVYEWGHLALTNTTKPVCTLRNTHTLWFALVTYRIPVTWPTEAVSHWLRSLWMKPSAWHDLHSLLFDKWHFNYRSCYLNKPSQICLEILRWCSFTSQLCLNLASDVSSIIAKEKSNQMRVYLLINNWDIAEIFLSYGHTEHDDSEATFRNDVWPLTSHLSVFHSSLSDLSMTLQSHEVEGQPSHLASVHETHQSNRLQSNATLQHHSCGCEAPRRDHSSRIMGGVWYFWVCG